MASKCGRPPCQSLRMQRPAIRKGRETPGRNSNLERLLINLNRFDGMRFVFSQDVVRRAGLLPDQEKQRSENAKSAQAGLTQDISFDMTIKPACRPSRPLLFASGDAPAIVWWCVGTTATTAPAPVTNSRRSK